MSGLISEIQNDKFNLPKRKSSIVKLSTPKINIVLIWNLQNRQNKSIKNVTTIAELKQDSFETGNLCHD